MMVRVPYLSIALGLVMTMDPLAVAADRPTSVDADPLVKSIQRLAERPADPARTLHTAREKLTASIEQLEQFLAGGGSEAAGRWSNWLGVSTLKQELDRTAPDFGALRSLEERFYENRTGLELPAFVSVRRNLRAFLTA